MAVAKEVTNVKSAKSPQTQPHHNPLEAKAAKLFTSIYNNPFGKCQNNTLSTMPGTGPGQPTQAYPTEKKYIGSH